MPGFPCALKFGTATSDVVDCGAAAGLTDFDPYTALIWCMPTQFLGGRQLIQKGTGGTNSTHISLRLLGTAGNFETVMDRATTDLNYTATAGTLKLNQRQFIGLTFDSAGGANNLVRLYCGIEGQPATDVTSGTTDGSGAFSSDSGKNLRIGNFLALTGSFVGPIYGAMYLNMKLTPDQIRDLQFHPRPIDGVKGGFWRMGRNGSSVVWDETGNQNHGVVSGAIPTSDYWPALANRRRAA